VVGDDSVHWLVARRFLIVIRLTLPLSGRQ
jgi:hypothetical protein